MGAAPNPRKPDTGKTRDLLNAIDNLYRRFALAPEGLKVRNGTIYYLGKPAITLENMPQAWAVYTIIVYSYEIETALLAKHLNMIQALSKSPREQQLERENDQLRQQVEGLKALIEDLQNQIDAPARDFIRIMFEHYAYPNRENTKGDKPHD